MISMRFQLPVSQNNINSMKQWKNSIIFIFHCTKYKMQNMTKSKRSKIEQRNLNNACYSGFYPGFCSLICSFNVRSRAVICIKSKEAIQRECDGKKHHELVDDGKKCRWSIHYSLWIIIIIFLLLPLSWPFLLLYSWFLVFRSWFIDFFLLIQFYLVVEKVYFILKFSIGKWSRRKKRWKKNLKFALWKQCNVFR